MNKTAKQKLLKWGSDKNKMTPNETGNMMVCYQTKEGDYQPRSFEDDFFKLNAQFIINSIIDEVALKPQALEDFKKNFDPYDLADKGIQSKAALAISLMLAERNGQEWQVPTYIKEGLLWIRN